MHHVPFTYAGTVDAYKLTSEMATAARCFGAKDEEGVRNTVQTSVTLGLVSGFFLPVSYPTAFTRSTYMTATTDFSEIYQ